MPQRLALHQEIVLQLGVLEWLNEGPVSGVVSLVSPVKLQRKVDDLEGGLPTLRRVGSRISPHRPHNEQVSIQEARPDQEMHWMPEVTFWPLWRLQEIWDLLKSRLVGTASCLFPPSRGTSAGARKTASERPHTQAASVYLKSILWKLSASCSSQVARISSAPALCAHGAPELRVSARHHLRVMQSKIHVLGMMKAVTYPPRCCLVWIAGVCCGVEDGGAECGRPTPAAPAASKPASSRHNAAAQRKTMQRA